MFEFWILLHTRSLPKVAPIIFSQLGLLVVSDPWIERIDTSRPLPLLIVSTRLSLYWCSARELTVYFDVTMKIWRVVVDLTFVPIMVQLSAGKKNIGAV